jgi:hypothetical protein
VTHDRVVAVAVDLQADGVVAGKKPARVPDVVWIQASEVIVEEQDA